MIEKIKTGIFRLYSNKFFPIFFYVLFYLLFFSPVLFSNSVLAPGDGYNYFIPVYETGKSLWTNLIFGGYPSFADPQMATWYIPQIIFSTLKIPFSYYVVFAYIIAGVFTYYLAFSLTKSKISSLVAGLIYGCSGFMMAHLGHVNMIQAAAWIPAILLSIEGLKNKNSIKYWLLLIISVSSTFFAGHPQIFLYAAIVSVIYFIYGLIASSNKKSYLLFVITGAILGLAICTIQILPTLESYKYTLRNSLSYQEFVGYAWSAANVPTLFFPYIYGGVGKSIYHYIYFGRENFTELAGYVGILSLFFSVVGIFKFFKKKLSVKVWTFISLLSFILMFGSLSPFSRILYHVPVYDLFRAHGRNAIIFSLSVAILSAFGIKYILKYYKKSRKFLLKIYSFFILVFILIYIAILIVGNKFIERCNHYNFDCSLDMFSPTKASILIPSIIIIVGLLLLIFIKRFNSKKFLGVFITFLVFLDIFSFSFFLEWNYYSPPKELLNINTQIKNYSDQANSNNNRVLTVDGVRDHGLPVNVSMMIGAQNVSGYSPLMLDRFQKVLTMTNFGALYGFDEKNPVEAFKDNNKILDLFSVQYLISSKYIDDLAKPQSNFKKIDEIGDDVIYENKNVFSRIRSVSEVKKYSADEIITIIKTSQFPDSTTYDPMKTALVEDDIDLTQYGSAEITNIKYSDTKIEFEVNSTGKAFIVIGDIYYPGWNAKINGQNANILRTNYLFRGISVPEGSSKVILEFTPQSFYTGGFISIIALICVTFFCLMYYKQLFIFKKNG